VRRQASRADVTAWTVVDGSNPPPAPRNGTLGEVKIRKIGADWIWTYEYERVSCVAAPHAGAS